MVTVLEIRRERSTVCILLDTGERFFLKSEDLPGTGISESAVFEEDAFLQQIRLRQYPRALSAAVSMLARRPCSSGEITDRLIRRRFIPEVTELVVYKLKKENLLDDELFCEQWIRYRIEHRFGPVRIRQELKMKGVPEPLINSTLSRMYDPEEESCHIAVLARKAWSRVRPGEDIRKSRQKVIVSLVRKGFGWEDARAASDAAESERE